MEVQTSGWNTAYFSMRAENHKPYENIKSPCAKIEFGIAIDTALLPNRILTSFNPASSVRINTSRISGSWKIYFANATGADNLAC